MVKEKPYMENEADKPPVFKNWNTLYCIVIIVQVFLITMFTLLTKAYS